jgi:AcrR family transcriptional regulator
VAAILEAGAAVFREKGYDSATMTEIAARSGTAFGSLYRFFPSKESLADALLAHYAQHALDGLAALAEAAPGLTVEAMADALVDFVLGLQADRSFVVAVLDARGPFLNKRAQFRAALRAGMVLIVSRMAPELPEAQAAASAVVVLHTLKGVAHAVEDAPEHDGALVMAYRHLVRCYLTGLTHPAFAAAGVPANPVRPRRAGPPRPSPPA